MSSQKATDPWLAGTDDEFVAEPRAGGTDLLIVAYINEIPPRDVDLHFPLRRVIPVVTARRRLEGWRGERIYYTDNALRAGTAADWDYIEFMARWAGGELLHANHFNTVKEPNV